MESKVQTFKTLDLTMRIGSKPTVLYFDLYLRGQLYKSLVNFNYS